MLKENTIADNVIIAVAGQRTKMRDNFKEDDKWVGSFKKNDKVKVERFPDSIAKVSACLGYGQYGYWYQVHFSEHSFANVYEFELELA